MLCGGLWFHEDQNWTLIAQWRKYCGPKATEFQFLHSRNTFPVTCTSSKGGSKCKRSHGKRSHGWESVLFCWSYYSYDHNRSHSEQWQFPTVLRRSTDKWRKASRGRLQDKNLLKLLSHSFFLHWEARGLIPSFRNLMVQRLLKLEWENRTPRKIIAMFFISWTLHSKNKMHANGIERYINPL